MVNEKVGVAFWTALRCGCGLLDSMYVYVRASTLSIIMFWERQENTVQREPYAHQALEKHSHGLSTWIVDKPHYLNEVPGIVEVNSRTAVRAWFSIIAAAVQAVNQPPSKVPGGLLYQSEKYKYFFIFFRISIVCCAHLIDVRMNRQSNLTVRCLDLTVGGAPRNSKDGVVVSHRMDYSRHQATLGESGARGREIMGLHD